MKKYSVAMTEDINVSLSNHLIRDDEQEDLCFAFYKTSTGNQRITALINEVIFPEIDDRNIHGNVSFNPDYFDKATSYALKNEYGIVFIHSHPFPGWQRMSTDDIEAETMLAPRVKAITGLPVVGMTIGSDGTWSARFWEKTASKTYDIKWCETVRVVGNGLNIHYNENLKPKPKFGQEFSRTISSWGPSKQESISRMKVGIVGMGSVGSIIAEALLRTGIENLVFIDFDTIERKNLDRLLAASEKDIGKFKVDFQKNRLFDVNLRKGLDIEALPYSITEKTGLEAALDCDLLFSCVDMPLPRFTLDGIAYSNFIPVIDGGIDTNPNSDLSNIEQARWKAHTVGPQRICMQCLGQYTPSDVSLEQSGELDNPYYIKGLPKDHFVNRGENVFGFSLSLAGMEIQQFLSMVLQPKGIYYGPKEMDFNFGNIDFDFENSCEKDCHIKAQLGQGDSFNKILLFDHPNAEKSRNKIQEPTMPKVKKANPKTSSGKDSIIKKAIRKLKNLFDDSKGTFPF